jgi:hypothetical protein
MKAQTVAVSSATRRGYCRFIADLIPGKYLPTSGAPTDVSGIVDGDLSEYHLRTQRNKKGSDRLTPFYFLFDFLAFPC